MATRFAQYQSSIKKFVANKCVITSYQFKDQLIKIMDDSEFILPISLLTIMNGQQKKNKLKLVHGYEMAIGIELLMILMMLLQTKKNLIVPKKLNIDNQIIDSLHTSLNSLINLAFNRNIDAITSHHNSNDIVKIFTVGTEHINVKINKIVSSIMTLEFPEKIITSPQTDLKNYHFKNANVIERLSTIKRLPKDFIIKYIDDTYGNACKLTLIIGWMLGGSSYTMINNIERLGRYFGFLIKLSTDFANLDIDIESCLQNKPTLNYVINCGLQESFEMFDENKMKFNELLLTLDITSSTLKELIDMLESNVNNALDNSSPDIKRSSSVASH